MYDFCLPMLKLKAVQVFNSVEIKPEMTGHYLGEFSISYKPVKHGRPGIGATHCRCPLFLWYLLLTYPFPDSVPLVRKSSLDILPSTDMSVAVFLSSNL